MKIFEGEILFLDRSDINTDEIIPAKYLTDVSREALKPYLFEELNLNGFDHKKSLTGKGVIITRKNFGCGSSREHALWALEQNNINVVIAESFARIFRQNSFNCGMLAIELPSDKIEMLFFKYANKKTIANVNFEKEEVTFCSENNSDVLKFKLGEFDKAVVSAGGWINYANKKY